MPLSPPGSPARRAAATLLAAAMCLGVAGCAGTPGRQAVPDALTKEAGIPGVPGARFWGDEWPKFSLEQFNAYTEADFQQYFSGIYAKPHNYLAISGGGANGAFGAGLLVGWTARGDRPEFTMVTGISTGALTAPFAFLGTAYDDVIKKLYTTTTTEQVVRKRSLVTAPFSESMADTTPLRALLEAYVDDAVIAAIAVEHAKGRRLFVGTVNLDAGRSVIWNIGMIAASDYPDRVSLIHDVLQASAAIPVAFPPVLIPVEANGQTYDEMHVDGGTASQVFVYPAAIDWPSLMEKLKAVGEPRVFIIRNAFLEPDFQGVKRNLLPIASRSIDSLIRTQGVGDLYQIHALCERDGNDFNLAFIPPDFTEKPTEGFDPVYMTKLFDRGYRMALAGYPWGKEPPGFARAR